MVTELKPSENKLQTEILLTEMLTEFDQEYYTFRSKLATLFKLKRSQGKV